jgi:hypothetical protein
VEREGEKTQPIVSRRLGWDNELGKVEIKKALGLVDEIAKVERRGRPRGCSHSKRKPPELNAYFPPDRLHDFLESRLTAGELKIAYCYLKFGKQARAAKELGVTPQAIHKRVKRIDAKLDKVIPGLSLRNALRAVWPLGSGQRWNRRPIEVDGSGTPYVRDVDQELDRR